MSERIFIVDSREPRLDAATARRQFSLSLAVGFAVLAAAAIIEFQPARAAHIAPSAPRAAPAHAPVSQYALASPGVVRD